MPFLAAAGSTSEIWGSGSGFNLWQSLGGLILVFGILILSLKLLGRFNRHRAPSQTSLLAVWNLGPKREIQVLSLGDEVHYIYRHEGAMVLLKQESRQQWQEFQAQSPSDPGVKGISRLFPGGLSFSGLLPGKGPKFSHSPSAAATDNLIPGLKS